MPQPSIPQHSREARRCLSCTLATGEVLPCTGVLCLYCFLFPPLSCPHLHGLGKPSSLNCHLCMSPHSKSVYLEGRVGTHWETGHPLTDSCTCCQTGSRTACRSGFPPGFLRATEAGDAAEQSQQQPNHRPPRWTRDWVASGPGGGKRGWGGGGDIW